MSAVEHQSGPAAGRAAQRVARVALSRVVEPGHAAVWAAVRDEGAASVWQALQAGRRVSGLSPALCAGAATRAAGYDPHEDLRRLADLGARLVCPDEPDWPHRLDWAPGVLADAPPLALYVRGRPGLAETVESSVAVVGARAATAYGVTVARELGLGLSERGVAVVSGAAYGIDAAAHDGALCAGAAPTVAVLACGVDVAYPRGHDRLLARIAATGLVVGELPPRCSPTRSRFLVRNRLIAALSVGTVVVEAAARSGSLSTVERARSLQRHVMAVPGPVTSALSTGANEQLRVPGTVCVTRVEEVLDVVGRLGEDASSPRRGRQDTRDALSATVRRVLEAVPVRRGAGEASIARTAGVAPLVVAQVLPPLLVAGLVERHPEGWRLTALGAGRPARAP